MYSYSTYSAVHIYTWQLHNADAELLARTVSGLGWTGLDWTKVIIFPYGVFTVIYFINC